ncbi:MepB family protein [Alkalicoccobacillus porphyridii]|uniref:Mep operon protein MepB n=1 Tax=Alkalicoccobacillus porphyridii TaxID=2597270 RepID=A0A553ZV21_9BACI|nr:MepB family protein [Alkalicoccobacillus porphyridii]TSB45338.1 mep operon protein MepB [Alkalicoccobacillus porphyridii]
MAEFYKVFKYINENLYMPNHLIVSDIHEEDQNSEYGAGVFQLNNKSVRFRVAKITPNKSGQFVSFWEKDINNKNQAFSYENAPDLLVINTFVDNKIGQFVFPKKILQQKNIYKSATVKGKMAIRVYPVWDNPTNKQAISTQKWQLKYFIKFDNSERLQHKLIDLYS